MKLLAALLLLSASLASAFTLKLENGAAHVHVDGVEIDAKEVNGVVVVSVNGGEEQVVEVGIATDVVNQVTGEVISVTVVSE